MKFGRLMTLSHFVLLRKRNVRIKNSKIVLFGSKLKNKRKETKPKNHSTKPKEKGLITPNPFLMCSSKDASRVIMTLVCHYDLELHQMDVKITFLNEKLNGKVFMLQLDSFHEYEKDYLVCVVSMVDKGFEKEMHELIQA